MYRNFSHSLWPLIVPYFQSILLVIMRFPQFLLEHGYSDSIESVKQSKKFQWFILTQPLGFNVYGSQQLKCSIHMQFPFTLHSFWQKNNNNNKKWNKQKYKSKLLPKLIKKIEISLSLYLFISFFSIFQSRAFRISSYI